MQMENQSQLGVKEIVAILRRRWVAMLVTFLIAFGAGVTVAAVLPPVYESSGIILVESQQIPPDFIRSTVTSFAGERIAIIKQRVMTRENLLRIIDKFGLFSEVRNKLTVASMVALMRERTTVALVDANVGGAGRRRGNTTTMAFKLTYEDRKPRLALSVANELVTLFLYENVKSRTERASETTAFLVHEAKKLQSQLESIERQIAAYKQQYGNALPEHLELHMARLDRIKSTFNDVDREIKANQEERSFLEVQLAAIRSGSATEVSAIGTAAPASPAQELAALRKEMASLSAVYSPAHPDVRALTRKIELLEVEIGGGFSGKALYDKLKSLRDEYAQAKRRYSSVHPDVVRLEQQIGLVQNQLDRFPAEGESQPEKAVPRVIDPLLATVQAKIASTDSRLKSLQAQKQELGKSIEELEAVILKIPQVDRGMIALSRDYENAKNKYAEIRAKQTEAQFAESLEEEEKAERFSLLEPPLLPESPVRPNRKKILGIGGFLAFSASGGIAILAEMLSPGIRGARRLSSILNHPPIGIIPYIWTRRELRRRRWRRGLLISLLVVIFVGVTAAIHVYYMPLGVLGTKLMARFGSG